MRLFSSYKLERAFAIVFLLSVAVLAAVDEAAIADPEGCREAIDRYKSAKSDVSDARSYANCISDSKGHDDCSSEFSALQSAQSDFESAVSDMKVNASSKPN